MSLLGTGFLLLVAALSVLVLVGCWVLWNRWPQVVLQPARVVSLLLVMVMGAVSAGAYANHVYGFYSSLSDLFGSISAQRYQPPASFDVPAGSASVTIQTANWQALTRSNAQNGHGTVLDVTFAGPTSHITRKGLLYLPAAYALGSQGADLPVIEMFSGYPGTPHNFTRNLDLAAVVDGEIAANRIPPVIVALPTSYERHSSECVNAAPSAGGERDETYLAVDVPADIESSFRAGKHRAFGALGYSEGGFCAVNLGLHHPDRYAAVASLSGFFTAGEDPRARPLYGRGNAVRDRNSPLWWVRHRSPTGPPMFLMSSTGDPVAVREVRQFRDAARRDAPRLHVVAPLLPGGGHNFFTWSKAFPAALDFIGSRLPSPLAPPLTVPLMPEPSPTAKGHTYIRTLPTAPTAGRGSSSPSARPTLRGTAPRHASLAPTPRPERSPTPGPTRSP